MHLMIPGAGKTVEAFCQDAALRPHLGFMVTPNTGNSIKRLCGWGIPWCADNAAFKLNRFDKRRFLAMCKKIQGAPTPPVFVNLPDQVGDHECTSYLFDAWYEYLEDRGVRLPWGFVLQNGIEDECDVPWERIAAVFVGGDDDFKEDAVVTEVLIPEARRRGKGVHMGRVNGRRRLRLALHADVDSVDGSSLARFSRTWIPSSSPTSGPWRRNGASSTPSSPGWSGRSRGWIPVTACFERSDHDHPLRGPHSGRKPPVPTPLYSDRLPDLRRLHRAGPGRLGL
jgi:hypothetical protein